MFTLQTGLLSRSLLYYLSRLFPSERHLFDGHHFFGGNIASLQAKKINKGEYQISDNDNAYVVDGTKAAMANFAQIVENLFRILLVEIL